ncbi:MAG: TetR/AcrR family transcriptional regulator [Verrucomicrobiae bacterium]|nr:TetR/AcrR family transcriptional regulator [Verrucomicrobiae bacterium]
MPVLAPEMPAKLARSAFELFARYGIRNVNLDRVAAHCGVTKGSLYWHFRSKRELVLAACEHYYQNYLATIRQAAGQTEDPGERLERVLKLSVKICLLDEKNRVFTMDVWALSAKDKMLRKSWRRFYDQVRQFFVQLLEQAGVTTSEAVRKADMMLGVFEGIKLRAMFEPEICAPSEAARIVAELKGMVSVPISRGDS